MYDENQLVTVKWNNTNKGWYSSRGYEFPGKTRVPFLVEAKDLMIHSDAKIKAICDYCGCEYQTIYASITNGRKIVPKDCCSKCTGKKTSEVSYVRRRNKYYGNLINVCDRNGYTLLTTPEEYTDIKMTIHFICPYHGEQSATLESMIKYRICPECARESKESIGENLIRNYLEMNNIPFEQEKRFYECRDEKPMPFDFYLPEINSVIEFDGQQHYWDVFGEEAHKATVKHDKMKDNYCKEHGIFLLRIPYWNRGHIPKILSQFIGKRYSLNLCESISSEIAS